MNIATIEQYVEQKNKWRSVFNQKPLSLLVKADRQTIANSIDSELSPENLTCDGEIRGTALRNKQNYLLRCANELVSIDPSVTFSEMGV